MSDKETKHEAFKRLAAQRTNTVLQKVRVLGHCANSQLYEYTDEDVRKVFSAIRRELKAAEARFNNRNHSADFRL